LRASFEGVLSSFIVLIFWGGFLHFVIQGCFHQGVLSHEHDCVHSSEFDSDSVDLVAAHVIAINQDGFLVLVSELPKLGPVALFLDSLL